MSELLARLNGGELIGMASVLGGMLIAIVAVVTMQWRRVRVAEFEAGLKQQMLEKGMSAAEIVQVMSAGSGSRSDSRVGSSGDATLDKAALTQQMIDNGYEGEDIERVLKAYQGAPKPVEERVSR